MKSILSVMGGWQDDEETNSVEMILTEGGCWRDGPNMPIEIQYPKWQILMRVCMYWTQTQ